MYEAHITCERISIEKLSGIAVAADVNFRFRTGDLLLHLNSFDVDEGDYCKSFFSAKGAKLPELRKRLAACVDWLQKQGVHVRRAKIERILQDERFP